jgi:hypothetical protein
MLLCIEARCSSISMKQTLLGNEDGTRHYLVSYVARSRVSERGREKWNRFQSLFQFYNLDTDEVWASLGWRVPDVVPSRSQMPVLQQQS